MREVTPQAMRQRVVTTQDRDFRPAFIDADLPGCGAEIAPVIGYGMTQNRDHAAPITNPHGFSTEWLRMAPGTRVSPFTLPDKMVIILHKGRMRITFDAGVSVDLDAWDTYSIPANAVRSIEVLGDETVEALMTISGDHRKRPVFNGDVIEAALTAGTGLDAGGFMAKAALLPSYRRAG